MSEKINLKPDSYETSEGRWIPSGVVQYGDESSVTEYRKEYKNVVKRSKKEADEYFLKTEGQKT